MAELTHDLILERLRSKFDAEILSTDVPYDLLTLEVTPDSIPGILQFLANDRILKFQFLTDICGNHFPDFKDRELCVIYHVHSMENQTRLRLKTYIPISNPIVPSVTSQYSSANWMERETYDFYGVQFAGHPNLTRILNVDEMDYFPLRREYPLEDGRRTDKEDKYFGR